MDRKSRRNPRIEKLYRENPYLEAYSRHTDLRVEADPRKAVGGMWEEIGALQFEFLRAMNLRPHHTMLDLGCGTLRGGRHFIRYLHPGHYAGIDISPKAILSAATLVRQEGLSNKRPRLLVSENRNLKFREFAGERFDYILAQSVFTHLQAEHIKECFEHVGGIMKSGGLFYFTYNKGAEYRRTGFKDFCYPFSFFEALAGQYGFVLQDRSQHYGHPRGQLMVELRNQAP